MCRYSENKKIKLFLKILFFLILLSHFYKFRLITILLCFVPFFLSDCLIDYFFVYLLVSLFFMFISLFNSLSNRFFFSDNSSLLFKKFYVCLISLLDCFCFFYCFFLVFVFYVCLIYLLVCFFEFLFHYWFDLFFLSLTFSVCLFLFEYLFIFVVVSLSLCVFVSLFV